MDRRGFLTLTSSFALTACGGGARMVSLDQVNRVGSKIVPILVATSRNVKPDGSLGSGRGDGLAFGRFDVSVPPERQAGAVPTSRFTNPRFHFATVNNEIFPSEALFRSQIAAQLVGSRRQAVIFVHGYNTGYEDGLYRFAQFYTDMGLTDVPVHYSWPSAERVLRYGYDRDSMLFARDGFERMLRDVVQAGAERVLLIGHSMGTMLIMETLREISIAGDAHLKSKIGGVVLVSPDIDIDVFRSQVERIGQVPQPFVVFSSRKDRVLAFAENEIYDHPRLGNIETGGSLSDLNVKIIDVSQYSKGLLNHSTAISSPAFLKIAANMQTFARAFGANARATAGSVPDGFISVEDAHHFSMGGI